MKLSALRYLWAQVLSLPSTPPSHPPSRFLTLLRAAQIWIKELTQDLDHRAERQKDLEAQLQALQPASHQSTRALTRIQQHAGVQQLSLSLSRSVSGWVGGWVFVSVFGSRLGLRHRRGTVSFVRRRFAGAAGCSSSGGGGGGGCVGDGAALR